MRGQRWPTRVSPPWVSSPRANDPIQKGPEPHKRAVLSSPAGTLLVDDEELMEVRSVLSDSRLAAHDAGSSTELVGTLVRHTPTGFAIEFSSADQVLRELVGRARMHVKT